MKNTSIVLGLALLAVGGSADAQSASGGQISQDVAQPTQRSSASAYLSHRGSGVLGRNRPLPGTPDPVVSAAGPAEVEESKYFCGEGEAQARKGNWSVAQSEYRRALNLWPESREALYGAAESAAALGDMASAVSDYRTAIYTKNPSRYDTAHSDGFQENDVKRLMQFSLALNRASQVAEAVSVYNHAASLLDYEDSQYHDGRPYLKVLLPELVAEHPLAAQVQYTSEHLQALADTALAHEESAFGSNKEAVAHMREAVRLYPDTAVTHYYLGEVLLGTGVSNGHAAKAAYAEAAQLGDEQVKAAATERLTQIWW